MVMTRMSPFEHILVATDFGPSSERALHLAVALAKQLHARLTLLHVWEPPPYAYGCRALISREELLRPGREAAQRQLDTMLDVIRKDLPDARGLVRCGDAVGQIGAAILEERPDVVFMGTHGRHGIDRMLVGSVAEQTVRSSPVPVLTVAGAPT